MIKFVLTTLLLCACLHGAAQNKKPDVNGNISRNNVWDFGFVYSLLQPGGAFSAQPNQIGLNAFAGKRMFDKRLMLGLEAGLAWQPTVMEDKVWAAENGTVNSSIHQESNIWNLALQTRYYLNSRGTVQYFVMASGGWLWLDGDINVYDMDDEECRLLEKMRPARASKPYGTLGAGLSLASRWLENITLEGYGRIKLDLTVQYLVSGNVRMYNVRNHTGALPPGAEPVELRFSDPRTNTQHTHPAGYVQQGRLRGWQFGLALSFTISTPKKNPQRKR